MTHRPQSPPPTSNTVARFIANSGSSLAAALIRLTVLVWVNQFLLRRISPEEYALVPVLTSLLIMFELTKGVFADGVARFLVEADARDDPTAMARIASTMFPVQCLVAAIIAILGVLSVLNIDSIIRVDPLYRDDARLMLGLLIGTLCLNLIATTFVTGLVVKLRFVEQNLILLGAEVLRVIVLVIFLFGVSVKALWLVAAASMATVFEISVLAIITLRLLPDLRISRRNISYKTFRQILSFSSWTFVQSLSQLVLRAAPAVLLNRYSTAINVTSFHLGQLPETQIRRLVTAATVPIVPALTNLFATQGAKGMTDLFYHGGRYHLWATLALVPPLVVFSVSLVRLYVGDTFSDSAVVMTCLLGAFPFAWASAMFYRIAYAIERIKAYSLCELLLVVVTFLALAYLVVIRDMGALGAGIAIAGSSILLHLCVFWPVGLRLVNGRWSDFFRQTVLPGCTPCVTAMLAAWGFAEVVPISSWIAFLGGSAFCGIVYMAVLFGFCLAPVDKALLAKAVARIRKPRAAE